MGFCCCSLSRSAATAAVYIYLSCHVAKAELSAFLSDPFLFLLLIPEATIKKAFFFLKGKKKKKKKTYERMKENCFWYKRDRRGRAISQRHRLHYKKLTHNHHNHTESSPYREAFPSSLPKPSKKIFILNRSDRYICVYPERAKTDNLANWRSKASSCSLSLFSFFHFILYISQLCTFLARVLFFSKAEHL